MERFTMPVSRPTLGYPSMTAAARALRAKGLRPCEVGLQLGIDHRQVSSLTTGRAVVHFPRDTMERLKPHAKRRGMSPSGLANAIVFAALEDEMVDAILDDLQ